MFKALFPAYLICFGLYILFSRQPDYFDGELTNGIIEIKNDVTGNSFASFTYNKKTFEVPADSFFPKYNQGERVQIIYEKSQPEKAAIYGFWTYWLSPGELLGSILIPLVFGFIAYSITKNPTPEALLEEMEATKKVKKPKYDL